MVMACRRRLLGDGQVESETLEFGTSTLQLSALSKWLSEWGCTHVAMESTGVLWIPVWNVLEVDFKLLLTNAQQLKKVPGRKRDVSDAEWIAQLMQCGLLKASFVPSREVRHWRTWTRQRMKLSDQHTGVVNRLHKVLQQGNIKLSSVATDVLGVSGRAMIWAMIEGESDPEALASLAKGRLESKHTQLVESLEGRLNQDDRWVLKELWEQLEYLEAEIARYDDQLTEKMSAYEESLRRLITIDLIERRSAENILAEIGPEAAAFPSAQQLASWIGVCPGSNESAGQNHSGRSAKGNRFLRRLLCQAAQAAARTNGSHLQSVFKRLVVRLGYVKAVWAIAHRICKIVWNVLRKGARFTEFSEARNPRAVQHAINHHLKALRRLGYSIPLVSQPAIAPTA